jgi:hypothetical protein
MNMDKDIILFGSSTNKTNKQTNKQTTKKKMEKNSKNKVE